MAFRLGFFGPLDKAQRMDIKMFPEPRIQPLARVYEPIKIKVIAV